MPRHGYSSISVRSDVKQRLARYAEEHGFSSLSDAIAHLLEVSEKCSKQLAKLDYVESVVRDVEAEQHKIFLTLKRVVEELERLGKQRHPRREPETGEENRVSAPDEV